MLLDLEDSIRGRNVPSNTPTTRAVDAGVHEEEIVESNLGPGLSLGVTFFLCELEAWYWARWITGEIQ